MRTAPVVMLFPFMICVACLTAHAQVPQQRLGGTAALQHTGRVVLRAGRLLGSHGDSASAVVVGRYRVWLLSSSAPLASLAPAGGSSKAFGVAATVLRAYRSPSFDALATGDPGTAVGTGSVALYFGGATMDSLPSVTLQGQFPGDLYGVSVSSVGDLNGDGYGDFAVGATGASAGAGKVYVYLGGSNPSTTPALVLSGQSAGDLFGTAITPTPNLDGSGSPAFAVSAPGANSGQGAVYVFRGGTTLSTTPVGALLGDQSASYGERPRFGASLASGGDLNGDGHGDLLVGAPGRNCESGRAFAYYSGATLPSTPNVTIDGSEPLSHLGGSVALDSLQAGTNAVLILGQPGALEGRGKVSGFAGGPGAPGRPTFELTGLAPDDRLGNSVVVTRGALSSFPGQLLMGAELADGSAVNAGAAFGYVAQPVLGVENTQVSIEADGEQLKAGGYVSTHTHLVLNLLGSDGISASASTVTVDSLPVPTARLTAAAVRAAQTTQSSVTGIGLDLTLTEGAHTLTALLVSASGQQVGAVSVRFNAAARLELIAPRLWPNPAHDLVRVAFTLTRPADYVFTIYDVQGRQVFERNATRGVAEQNAFIWDGRTPSGRLESGVFFYRLSARYQGESVKSQGRLVILR